MSEGTAKEIRICGAIVKLGDMMKVRYARGDRHKGMIIRGIVTELWEGVPAQARLSCGWCFHDGDEIHFHKSTRVYMDGNQHCAVCDDFENLQESPAGFGDTEKAALDALVKEVFKRR